MWKRIIASLLIVLSLISLSTFSYATTTVPTVDLTKYEVLKPEKLSYSTEDKVILINGKAPLGTEITMELFGTTDLTKKNFNLDKLPTEKDYITLLTEKVNSGNMGLFQKQMELVKGINKLTINFGVEGVPEVEIIVYVYERAKRSPIIRITREVRTNEILPLLR